jgi:exodeoxyribonuclease-3
MKLITWNVNSIVKRYNHVLKILQTEDPEIVLLQETKTDLIFEFENYHSFFSKGIKGRSGVCILLKKKKFVKENIVCEELFSSRLLRIEYGNFSCYNLYVPQGGSELSNSTMKVQFLYDLYEYIKKDNKNIKIVGGDFNVSTNLREVSSKDYISRLDECEAFLLYKDTKLIDSVGSYTEKEKYLTWWDYRGMSFYKNLGMGLDRFLLDGLEITSLKVLLSFRRLPTPSDHAPVVIEVSKKK